MLIGYSSAVEIGDSFMCYGKKCFRQLKINYFNIKKNVLFWGTPSKSQGGKHDGDSYFACYLTDHTNWKRFWINFSSERMGIPFCEALLSNVTLLYFARTFYVFVVPSGGLTLASSQPPTQPLAHSSPLCTDGMRRENRKNKSKKTCVSR